MTRGVVVAGASAGGLATAEALRRFGFDGPITLIGDEARPPYDRPPLSKQLLCGQWDVDRLHLRPAEAIAELDLDLRLGVCATALHPAAHVVELADGNRVPYNELVVATGVRPRRLPGTGDLPNVHELRTVDDALALRIGLRPGRRLLVVGGGFIGAEVAATARELGAQVTVLEAGPALMARVVGAVVGEFLAAVHRSAGVEVRTGVAVDRVLRDDGIATGVLLADGTVLDADNILMAIGSVPATDWLADSGLTLDRGLVCDEHCRAAPNIYAVGDVARWHNSLFGTAMRIEHRTNAGEQALTVARNILHPGAARPYAPVPYFWSDQYELKVHAYGYLVGHDETAVVAGSLDSTVDRTRVLVAYRRRDLLCGVLGIGVPPGELRKWRSLIAARTPWSDAVAAGRAAA